MTRVGVVTQARMTSSRLPGKVLMEAGGRTVLDHHLDRLEAAGLDVYVATTTNAADDPVHEVCLQRDVPVHRGSEVDVLERFAGAAKEFELDAVVRVTSDCPLIDGEVVNDGVQIFLAAADPHLYVSNTLVRSFPRGFDFEVFSAQALLEADSRATLGYHREHVTPFLYENFIGQFRSRNVSWPVDKSTYRLTLDTVEDLHLITTMIEQMGAAYRSCGELIRILDENPHLVEINRNVEQKKTSG